MARATPYRHRRVGGGPLPALALLVCCCWLGGCDNMVAPLVETPREFFSVFGRLDAPADTQFVRVEPIRPQLDPPPGAPLNATVTSTEVETGTAVTWQDSLVQTAEGGPAHLFFARFSPVPGRAYRLEVRGADGQSTQATTRVPPAPSPAVGEAELSGTQYTQQLRWQGLRAGPVNATLYYTVARTEGEPPVDVAVSYAGAGRVGTDFWDVGLRLSVDQNVVRERIGLLAGERGYFYGVRMVIDVESEAWRQPERNTVERGRGFFGAVGHFRFSWKLDRPVVTSMNYLDRQP